MGKGSILSGIHVITVRTCGKDVGGEWQQTANNTQGTREYDKSPTSKIYTTGARNNGRV